MERAITLLAQSKLGEDCLSGDALAMAAWPRAAGPKVARHTKAVSVVRGRLVVEVDDEEWRRQLRPLTSQIIERLGKLAGRSAITDIEFRSTPQRRMPGREQSIVRGSASPPVTNVDGILDPTLAHIYKVRRAAAKPPRREEGPLPGAVASSKETA